MKDDSSGAMQALPCLQVSLKQAQAIAEVVRDSASQFRNAKRAWERLAKDVLLLLMGVRDLVMVDYAVVSAQWIAGMVESVKQHLSVGENLQIAIFLRLHGLKK